MTDTSTHLPIAGLIRRLMAIIYDSLLLLGVTFAYGVLLTVIRVSILGRDELDYVNIPYIFHILSWILLWIILSGYYVLCWTKRGQTLGMKSWRLRLESENGGFVSVQTAWIRCLLALVALLPAGFGYIRILFDQSRGCWHDQWTGTRVVTTPREKKTARV